METKQSMVCMRRLLDMQKSFVVVLCLVLMGLIGAVDRMTGRDFALSAVYLLPICWATWVGGAGIGAIFAASGAATWFVTDRASGFVYTHALTPYWNALMLFVLYAVVVGLLAAFKRAHYHLEKVVEERTAALQLEMKERRQLEAAQLQSERLAVVGSMAAQVAHEVRNPLGSITLNLDLIEREISAVAGADERLGDEARTLLRDTRAEVRRIQRVIQDYLQFARLPKLNKQPIDLNEFLGLKLTFLEAELEQAGVTVQTHFDPALTTLNGDGEQLWQAVLNLVRNACEAMPDGGKLVIGTWRDNKRVLLRVTDNGRGMSKDARDHLFQPFFTTKREGTGLGLALVQQIVTEHGGFVECESAKGKGSTFTICLPLGTETLRAPDQEADLIYENAP